MQPDRDNTPPTAQDAGDSSQSQTKTGRNWLKLAQDAYNSSTSYIDSNLRKKWEDGIRAFNSQHSTDSKYNSDSYSKRSKLFRPKTRSIIRKNEAQGAAAFFSNMDVVDLQAVDQTNRRKTAGAAVMKALLQHRLTKYVPWYQIVLGGLQDAQTVGVACAHAYWDYKKKEPKEKVEEIEETNEPENEYPEQTKVPENAFSVEKEKPVVVGIHIEAPEESGPIPMSAASPLPGPTAPGQTAPAAPAIPQQTTSQLPPVAQPQAPQQQPQQPGIQQEQPKPEPPVVKDPPLRDQPKVDLIPVENIRIHPSADWTDPINTSPYVIHLIPMYVMDVKEKMEAGEWRKLSDQQILASAQSIPDSTRASRQKDREDPTTNSRGTIDDYMVVWVQRHIHRYDDEDWTFYTMGTSSLLSDPVPLKSVVFHGRRPYVMGCCILETHKTYPGGVSDLGKNLQEESNEIVNQRIDNVKFVLNKKWFIKRGKDVDVAGLVRNVPGGVVSMDDPANDVREITFNDVTSSAFEEQSRIDNDMSELLGNFSAAQVMADHGVNGPARNMQLLNQSSGTLVEYLLKTYVETFVQPLLRQIMMLEQEYETDQTIIAVAATQAKLFEKYGVNEATDQLLDQELELNVNVGMGATDPQMRLNKLTVALNTYTSVAAATQKIPGLSLNMSEIGKEIFGAVGFSDGTRFLTTDNPEVSLLQGRLNQAMMVIQQLNQKLQDKSMGHQVKAQATIANNETKTRIAAMHEDAMNLRHAVTQKANLVKDQQALLQESMLAALQHRMDQRKTDGVQTSTPRKMGDQ